MFMNSCSALSVHLTHEFEVDYFFLALPKGSFTVVDQIRGDTLGLDGVVISLVLEGIYFGPDKYTLAVRLFNIPSA